MYGWVDDEYDKIPVEQAIMGNPGLPGTIVRLPMVYGPGDPGHRLFPILKRVDDGRPAILLEESMAAWRGCRGYVENVAHAIALAVHLNRSAGRIYNVAFPENFSELEWTRRVAEQAGFQGQFIVLPESEAPASLKVPYRMEQHWAADSRRIREELGYTEPIGLDEALDRTIAWERANPAKFDPKQFDYEAEDRALAARRQSIT
jgi:nucleoside-diphosphate-sugar epimerase